jgi:hypothetical protein
MLIALVLSAALGQSRHASAVADEPFPRRAIPAALMVAEPPARVPPAPSATRIADLEREVAGLRSRVAELEKARALPAAPTVVKDWYDLRTEPGVQGYGALSAAGRVIVERRRYKAQPATTTVYRYRYVTPSDAATWALPAWGTAYGSTCTVDRFGRVYCR